MPPTRCRRPRGRGPMTFEPGLPVVLFPVVDAAGLVDELLDAESLGQVRELLARAVAAGRLPDIVARQVEVWNELKATSPTYVADYEAIFPAMGPEAQR